MKRPAIAAMVLLASCARAPETLPSHRTALAELAGSGRPLVETDHLDIGDPSARPALWQGWGPDEGGGATSFAWGAGRSSRLQLEVVEPRARTLRMTVWSFPFGDDPPQEVRLELNGHEVARRVLSTRMGSLEAAIGGRAWQPGENFLELRYERQGKAPGGQPWSAAWADLRLDDARPGSAGSPRFEAGSGVLVLPARTGFEWALELPGGSWLAWDRAEGVDGARLAIDVTTEQGESSETVSTRAAGQLRLNAAGEPYRLTGLRLRALGAAGEVRLSGARLHLPGEAADSPRSRRGREAVPQRPNLLLYVVDSLRADHLGCYGYPRPVSPAIDNFAAASTRWLEARAQSSATRPAFASLLSGLYPVEHGVLGSTDPLSEQVVTLSERLGAAGYETAMFTTQRTLGGRFGFDQGWSRFEVLAERPHSAELHVQSPQLNRQVLAWLDRRDPSRPFFLVVHSSDASAPYTPTPATLRRLGDETVEAGFGTAAGLAELHRLDAAAAQARRPAVVALYDAEIRQNDRAFGDLRRALERRGLAASTVVALTSDHGEEFLEHGGWQHGRTLFEEELRIPLILHRPDQADGGTVATTAEQIDLAPTLLALAGLPPAPELPGRDLFADTGAATLPRSSFAWLTRPGARLSAVEREQWKLIHREGNWVPPAGASPWALYALGSDPEEQEDLAVEEPLRRLWLSGELGGLGRAAYP